MSTDNNLDLSNNLDISNNSSFQLHTQFVSPITLDTPIDASVKIHSYAFTLNNIILHTGLSYTIFLYDSLSNPLFTIYGEITGQEYHNWGSDDTYMENLLLNKIHDYISNLDN